MARRAAHDLLGAMLCYTALHGAINLEVNGHLPPPLAGSEQLFELTMSTVLAGITR